MLVASGLLALIVGAAFTVLLVTIADLRRSEQMAFHSEEVLVAANRLERLVVDIEAGERGFLVTGQDSSLTLWQSGQAAVPGQAATLAQMVVDNPQQFAVASRIERDAVG